jgi:hypothetical protein
MIVGVIGRAVLEEYVRIVKGGIGVEERSEYQCHPRAGGDPE